MTTRYDMVVVGSGPAGLHAAVTAAEGGMRVAVVERERSIGGSCVHRGTIPSKTLRETALQLTRARRHLPVGELDEATEVSSLMTNLDHVVTAHVGYMTQQAESAGCVRIHGRAKLVGPHELEITKVRGPKTTVQADHIVLAVGSSPRRPPNVPIDHENVLDSDSILSMIYLPASLTVLGGGVIACEWASIFAALGVDVTIVDRNDRPLGFLDRALTDHFVKAFERAGGRYMASREIADVSWDGVSEVVTRLESGERVRTRKMLCALGRCSNARGLGLESVGIETTKRDLLTVDAQFRTSVPHIYAVGDVIGFPALAATSMDQGRRAAQHALGQSAGQVEATIPVGIFTIPEMSCVGLAPEQAIDEHGAALVGTGRFEQVARGHIQGNPEGFLQLVFTPDGSRVVGAQVAGDGATELVAVAQMAIAGAMPLEAFVDNIFNFPTLAEAYRVAALDALAQRDAAPKAA